MDGNDERRNLVQKADHDKMTDMSKAKFHVLYDGPALENNVMDVNDLAPALLALGDLLEEANRSINGPGTKITLNVKASFKTGCFGIELDVVQSLMQQLGGLFRPDRVAAAQNILMWIGLVGAPMSTYQGLIWLIKKLKGQPLTKVTLLDNGKVRFLLDSESVEIEAQVIELYRNAKLRKALEDVLKPLETDGINEFAVTDEPQSSRYVVVHKDEKRYFSAPEQATETLSVTEAETNLQLVSVSFREDNKWRFSEGDSPFYAQIADAKFLARVQNNEQFSAGDILKVRLERIQKLTGDTIKTDYKIKEVLDHRKASVQIPMEFDREHGPN